MLVLGSRAGLRESLKFGVSGRVRRVSGKVRVTIVLAGVEVLGVEITYCLGPRGAVAGERIAEIIRACLVSERVSE